MRESKDTIWVLVQAAEEDGSRSALPSIGRKVLSKSFEITNDILAANLEAFFNSFKEVLKRLPNDPGGFSIDQVELTLAVNANGGVELLGKVDAGVTTGLNFTLRKSRD